MNINKKYIIILSLILCLIMIKTTHANSNSDYFLTLVDQDGEVVFEKKVEIAKEFIITFIHSSELEPWHNFFEVAKNEKFVLKKIMVPSTGPGVPSVLPKDKDWKFKISSGYFIYSNVNEEYKELDFIVSKISPHYLIINGESFNLVELSKDWANLKLKVGRKE